MGISRRDKGLLFRVRDLYRTLTALHATLAQIEAHEKLEPTSLSLRIDLSQKLKSAAKTLAIEEGKQAADFENFGILLNNLEETKKGRRTWPVKKKI